MKKIVKFEFVFGDPTHFGGYNSSRRDVRMWLQAYTQEFGDDEDLIITRLTFGLNHEYIHVAQDNIDELTHDKTNSCERQAYYLIGNGGNDFFHEYYNIDVNKNWIKTIGLKT